MVEFLQRPSFYIMIAILVFNMTQRSHHEHGEKKRFATLNMAIMLLLFNGSLAVILRYQLPDYFLIAGVAITGLAAFIMRKKTFIFSLKCRECGGYFPIKQILYFDNPTCENCSKTVVDESDSVIVPEKVADIDWDDWEPKETAVLCFVEDNDKLMLIHKKTGLGAGKINAPGGRIESGETAVEAAVRETEEETGIVPSDLTEMVQLHFQFKDGYSLKGHVFYAKSFTGEMKETEEAKPFWCAKDAIPFDEMWADDILWIPSMLEGKKVRGWFIFDEDNMVDHSLKNWDEVD